MTDTASVNEAVDRILDEQGHVACLINNAGYGQFGPLEDVPVDRLKRQFEVKTFGAHRLTRAVLPSMRERDSGTIINNPSIYGRVPMIGQGAYCLRSTRSKGSARRFERRSPSTIIDIGLIEPSQSTPDSTKLRSGEGRDRSFRYVRVVRRDVRRSDVH